MNKIIACTVTLFRRIRLTDNDGVKSADNNYRDRCISIVNVFKLYSKWAACDFWGSECRVVHPNEIEGDENDNADSIKGTWSGAEKVTRTFLFARWLKFTKYYVARYGLLSTGKKIIHSAQYSLRDDHNRFRYFYDNPAQWTPNYTYSTRYVNVR